MRSLITSTRIKPLRGVHTSMEKGAIVSGCLATNYKSAVGVLYFTLIFIYKLGSILPPLIYCHHKFYACRMEKTTTLRDFILSKSDVVQPPSLLPYGKAQKLKEDRERRRYGRRGNTWSCFHAVHCLTKSKNF